MKPETEKALNLANILLGVGILLLVVPIGFALITLATAQGEPPLEALVSVGWVCFIVLSLLPLGIGGMVGGLTWMTYLRRKARLEDIAEDSTSDAIHSSDAEKAKDA